MHKLLILLAVIPLAACGESDRTALTEAQLSERTPINEVDFGSDSGDWANDGECDDSRFKGPGMTDTPLLDEDTMADASDCRAAYARGELMLKE